MSSIDCCYSFSGGARLLRRIQKSMKNHFSKSFTVASILTGISFLASANAGTIFGTGWGKTPGAGVQDDYWQVVAVPSSTVPGAVPNAFPSAAPYYAYVPETVSPSWMGGSNNAGDGDGNRWVSIYNNSNLSAFSFGNWQPYSFVLAQTFTIPADDTYEFIFYGAGDDYMAFYVNGTVTNVAPTANDPANQQWYDDRVDNFPAIVGGTQITTNNPAMPGIGGWGFPFGDAPSYNGIAGTSGNGNFGNLVQFTGSVFLTAGTHTAYAVVYDTGGEAGALIGTSTFTVIPEPSSAALLLFGAGAAFLLRRKKQRAAKEAEATLVG